MKITEALVSATALLALGSMPRLAEAQCFAQYTDYTINEAQGTISAEAYFEEIHNPECPWAYAYQYGYFEHHHSNSVSIESPTGRWATGEDYQIVPYGGGSAYAWTSLSYIGDPGVYDIDWFIGVICTVGGPLVMWWDSLYVEIETPPCTTVEVAGYTASLLFGTLAKGLRYRVYLSDFENRIFRFKVIAYTPDVPDSGARNDIASESLRWDKNKTLCGEDYHSDITHEWSSDINSVNVRVTVNPELEFEEEEPLGGTYQEQACEGKDCIRLNPERDPHVYGHEIGHALGFLHSVVPTDIMCKGSGLCVVGDVESWHIRKLLDAYGTYEFF